MALLTERRWPACSAQSLLCSRVPVSRYPSGNPSCQCLYRVPGPALS